MILKTYSAFVSSEFESLRDERNEVIECLLDHQIMPVCMEHFTVPTNEKFDFIKKSIENSDVFILLLGGRYGSSDESGISWTQKEYEYARELDKPTVAIVCDELVALQAKSPETYTENQRKQIEFAKKVEFSRAVKNGYTITKILTTYFSSFDFSSCVGWSRNTDELRGKKLQEWQERNKFYDLGGEWYHFHINPEHTNYLRIGTVTISQDFTPLNYKELKLIGTNYSALYDKEGDRLLEVKAQTSHWQGDYEITNNGKIVGEFSVTRKFNGAFGEEIVQRGDRRGLHEFMLGMDKGCRVVSIEGSFFDVAPSPKYGTIVLFRSAEDRFDSLKNDYLVTLLQNVLK